jgi:DNA topoisomerase IA
LFDKKAVDEDASQSKSEVLFANDASAKKIIDSLGKDFKVYAIDEPIFRSRHQPAPLKTSTMQITAINKLG